MSNKSKGREKKEARGVDHGEHVCESERGSEDEEGEGEGETGWAWAMQMRAKGLRERGVLKSSTSSLDNTDELKGADRGKG